MTSFSDEVQEAIITNAFCGELTKSAFFETFRAFTNPSGRAAARIGMNVDKARKATKVTQKAVAKQEKFVARAEADLSRLQSDVQGVKPPAAKKSNVPLALAALGLGGLGFGYYQYKKNKDDQLARTYSQVS